MKKKLKISASISHLEGADYVNVLSRGREKVICWIHGTKKFDENIEGRTGWLRRNVLIPVLTNRSDLIVTVSETIRFELINDFAIDEKKIVTVYNGFDSEQIMERKREPLSGEFKFQDDSVLIVTHCRLSRQKNLFALLRIHAEICKSKQHPLLILGDGELRNELLSFSRELNLRTFDVWSGMQFTVDHDVFFLGYQTNPYRYLSRASMYVMTSGWEGFPLALCEALACGVTVVSSDCPTGPREILAPSQNIHGQATKKSIRGEFGILMPLAIDNDKNVIRYWAEELIGILEDKELLSAYSAKGPQRVKEFELKSTVAKVLKIISNLLNPN